MGVEVCVGVTVGLVSVDVGVYVKVAGGVNVGGGVGVPNPTSGVKQFVNSTADTTTVASIPAYLSRFLEPPSLPVVIVASLITV